MTYGEFKDSLNHTTEPKGLSVYLLSLWFDGRGDWVSAHSLVDSLAGEDAAHVHAYLHRKEGDIGNADYWYRRAAQTRPSLSLDQEWESLVKKFLNRGK